MTRDFRRFFSARLLSVLSVQAESAAIGWQVYTLARTRNDVGQSAFLLGMVGLAQFLPLFLLSFVAGSLADRASRKGISAVCLVVEFFCALALALSPARLANVFVIAALFGASRAFLQPAAQALGPMLVPKEELPRAVSLGQLGDTAASIIGPWLGGVLCAVSVRSAYAGCAALYVLSLLVLFAVRANTRPNAAPVSHVQHIKEGLRYVRHNRVVFGAISLDLFAVLLGSAGALLPIYARDILHIGAEGFGALRSGPAIGAAAMALALSYAPIKKHAGRWMFFGVAVYGVATLVFAVSTWLALSLTALAVLGAADMISVYVRQSLIQIATPDEMRGRVAAVSGIAKGGQARMKKSRTKPEALRREELFAAAERVFKKHGVARASVANITEAVGLAKGSFYLHFQSKDDLVEKMRARFAAALCARIAAAVEAAKTYPEKIRAWAHAGVAAYADAHALHAVLFAGMSTRHGLSDNAVIEHLRALLESGNKARAWRVKDAAFMARFLFSALHGVVMNKERALAAKFAEACSNAVGAT